MILALGSKQGFIMLLMLGAFAGPYALGAPWGYRYRYPAEGLLILFACSAVLISMAWGIKRFTKDANSNNQNNPLETIEHG